MLGKFEREPAPRLPHVWLQEEFSRRRGKNPGYSLRAFARQLQISPGRLSELLNRKRKVTARAAGKIALRLHLDPVQTAEFVGCAGQKKERDGDLGQEAFLQLSHDTFATISDWYHFAILSLLETEGFQSGAGWIARALGISTVEAAGALDRLERLGLIEHRGRRILRTAKNLSTTNDISSAAIRKAHGQILERSIQALDLPVEDRDITSITMAIDPARLPEAKKMIRNFRRKLCAFLENDPKRAVYHLNVQLVPVTKEKKTP